MSQNNKNGKKSLDEYGIIFISGTIDQSAAEHVCQDIIRINEEENADFIQFIINSSGGLCSAGFAIIDMMDWSHLPVYTTGIGIIASMALAVFMAGEKGRRVITPRTSILSHRFSSLSFGNHSELIAKRKEEDLMHKRLLEHYKQHTSLETEKDITEKLLRDVDTWLTPQESINMGITDVIQKDRKNNF